MTEFALSRKVYLSIEPPTEEDARSDVQRLLDALAVTFGTVRVESDVMRSIYPLCRRAEWKITAALVYRGREWQLVAVEPGDTTAFHYGLAVDLGSTSITMELVDMSTGAVVEKASQYNRQTAYGTDVLTRIFYGKDDPEHIRELQQAAIDTLVELMDELWEKTEVDLSRCTVMVIAGNTVMVNFLLGMDGFPIFHSPYAPVVTDPGFLSAAELDLPFSGLVYLFPSRANYLGGDIISGMISTGMSQAENIQLFFDIGTNGELVAGCRDFLVCGAGAAGPALEGGVIRTGMRAAEGAVEYVSLRGGRVELSVIGGGKAAGICGSGIVDMIAELFLEGIVDFRGVFQPESSERVEQVGEELAFRYADAGDTVDGEPLYFYQSDIKQFLDTKAAAYTMVDYMLRAVGMDFSDVEHFYVAGAFGTYIRTESAVNIGLYPDIPEEQIRCVGNSSLDGARMLLMDRSLLQEAQAILERMVYIQYGAIDNFLENMRAAAAIPHMNMSAYPSVERRLQERRGEKGT